MTTKDDVETLSKQLQIGETKIKEMEQKLQDCKREHAGEDQHELEQELEKQKEEIAKMRLLKELQDKIKVIEETSKKKAQEDEERWKASEDKFSIYMQKTEQLEKSRAALQMGQLCANVTTDIYIKVLPASSFTKDSRQPHLSDIEKKIEELSIADHREDAWTKWETLQKEEKIDEELVNFMEQTLKKRNLEAHPFPLYETELRDIARTLPDQEEKKLFEKVIQISKDMRLMTLIPSK